MENDYDIVTAPFDFTCPITGCKVRRGENCVKDMDGYYYSISLLSIT